MSLYPTCAVHCHRLLICCPTLGIHLFHSHFLAVMALTLEKVYISAWLFSDTTVLLPLFVILWEYCGDYISSSRNSKLPIVFNVLISRWKSRSWRSWQCGTQSTDKSINYKRWDCWIWTWWDAKNHSFHMSTKCTMGGGESRQRPSYQHTYHDNFGYGWTAALAGYQKTGGYSAPFSICNCANLGSWHFI